jgi:hypothetical protein
MPAQKASRIKNTIADIKPASNATSSTASIQDAETSFFMAFFRINDSSGKADLIIKIVCAPFSFRFRPRCYPNAEKSRRLNSCRFQILSTDLCPMGRDCQPFTYLHTARGRRVSKEPTISRFPIRAAGLNNVKSALHPRLTSLLDGYNYETRRRLPSPSCRL